MLETLKALGTSEAGLKTAEEMRKANISEEDIKAVCDEVTASMVGKNEKALN